MRRCNTVENIHIHKVIGLWDRVIFVRESQAIMRVGKGGGGGGCVAHGSRELKSKIHGSHKLKQTFHESRTIQRVL